MTFLVSSICVFILPSVLHICSADGFSLGRVDLSVLSEQDRMELLAIGLECELSYYQDSDGSFTDYHDWRAVVCDEEKNITAFRVGRTPWYAGPMYLTGTIDTCLFPHQLGEFSANDNKLHGEVNLETLPENLRKFCIQSNMCHGEINLIALPETLQLLDLRKNKFSGSLNLARLPEALTKLFCAENNFSGSIDLKSLPKAMSFLYLEKNGLTGKLNLDTFPESLLYIDLSANCFVGSFYAPILPESLKRIDVMGNRLSGVAVVPSNTNVYIILGKNAFTEVEDAKGLVPSNTVCSVLLNLRKGTQQVE